MNSSESGRFQSLDAFRGLTILGMIFVIAIAAGRYQESSAPLPLTRSWFGSLPISTWFHSDIGWDLFETRRTDEIIAELKKKEVTDKAMISQEVKKALENSPEFPLRSIGVTATDLVAPWFVFIVGACIPLSRQKRGREWWTHVGSRTLKLIVLGVIYIALVIKQVTWWWGILQAIGVAYFCAALLCRAPTRSRLAIIFAIGAINIYLTKYFPFWTTAFDSARPFGSLFNPNGDWLKPWVIHCRPWLSISYGTMAMIGVLLGDALATKNQRLIVTRGLLVALGFMSIGYAIHKIGFVTGQLSLCMSKPDVTTSYAFFTSGLGALTYIGFYYLIDVWKINLWAWPLMVFGMNPLLAYFTQILMRRAFESLGIIGFFNLPTADNTLVMNWAMFFGVNGQPSPEVLHFFAKGGYHGVRWGLIWTFCLWLVVLYCNKKNIYWKL